MVKESIFARHKKIWWRPVMRDAREMFWMPCTPDADAGDACVRLDADQQASRLRHVKG
jgi:hypothetical protein